MMIFSVNIAGYGTSNRNEFCAWRHRQKPTCGNNNFQHLVERDSALAFKHAVLGIEGKDIIIFQGGDCYIGKRRISITSSISPRNKFCFLLKDFTQLLI